MDNHLTLILSPSPARITDIQTYSIEVPLVLFVFVIVTTPSTVDFVYYYCQLLLVQFYHYRCCSLLLLLCVLSSLGFSIIEKFSTRKGVQRGTLHFQNPVKRLGSRILGFRVLGFRV